MQHLDHN